MKPNRAGKCAEITLWHVFKGDSLLDSAVRKSDVKTLGPLGTKNDRLCLRSR